jgi:hypothetical protein
LAEVPPIAVLSLFKGLADYGTLRRAGGAQASRAEAGLKRWCSARPAPPSQRRGGDFVSDSMISGLYVLKSDSERKMYWSYGERLIGCGDSEKTSKFQSTTISDFWKQKNRNFRSRFPDCG